MRARYSARTLWRVDKICGQERKRKERGEDRVRRGARKEGKSEGRVKGRERGVKEEGEGKRG